LTKWAERTEVHGAVIFILHEHEKNWGHSTMWSTSSCAYLTSHSSL